MYLAIGRYGLSILGGLPPDCSKGTYHIIAARQGIYALLRRVN